MSKLSKILFASIVTITLTACGGSSGKNPDDSSNQQTQQEMQAEAIKKIREYAKTDGASASPTIEDYKNAGIVGLDNEEELNKLNEAIKNYEEGDITTKDKIEEIANSIGVGATYGPVSFNGNNLVRANLRLSKSGFEIKAGDKFDVVLNMKGAGKKIGAINAFIRFDSRYLEVVTSDGVDPSKDTGRGFHKGEDASSYEMISNVNDANNGNFRFAAIATQNHITGGNMQEVIKIHIKAKEALVPSINTHIRLDVVELTDELGNSLK